MRFLGKVALFCVALCVPLTGLAATTMMPDRDAVVTTPVVVWGNTTEVAGPVTISFGDGTPDSTPAFNINSQSYIATTHAYAATGIYTVTLTVNGVSDTAEVTVFDPAALSASEEEGLLVNNAIQDGLRYQYFSVDSRETRHDAGWNLASWQNSHAFSSMATLAFENHGYTRLSGDIYSPVVQGGLNFIFSGLSTQLIGAQPAGDPCLGGIPSPCNGLIPPVTQGYATSIALLAIVGSQSPGAIVDAGLGSVGGQAYLEVAQRLANTVAWGQEDPGQSGRGGWQYSLNVGSDGSAIGWNVLGLLDAAAFGAVVAGFVAPELEHEIERTTNTTGGMGYTANNSIPNTAKTGVRLSALNMIGVPLGGVTAVTTVTPQKSVDYINDGWNAGGSCVWGSAHPTAGSPNLVNDHICIYSMFNVFKGLKLYGVTTLANVPRADLDWHKFYQMFLQGIQTAPTATTGGSFSALSGFGFSTQGETALALLVLAPTALILPDEDIFADVGLAPETATNPVGTSHTVTATARSTAGAGIPSVTIDFEVLSGPNAGETGTGITDANGEADFTYTDTAGPGTDTIQAIIGKGTNNELRSNIVEKIWEDQAVVVVCDVDGDGSVTRTDLRLVARARGQTVPPADAAYDLDGDGVITRTDYRICIVEYMKQ